MSASEFALILNPLWKLVEPWLNSAMTSLKSIKYLRNIHAYA